MRLHTAVFAVAVLFVSAAAAAPASAGVRFGLRLESATVLAGGTTVDVHYIALCPPGTMAGLSVSLAQRTGRHVAVGADGTVLICTGLPSSVRLRITAGGGGFSFRPGRARAAADLRTTIGLGLRTDDDRARLVVLKR
jgi:hypothetical protein